MPQRKSGDSVSPVNANTTVESPLAARLRLEWRTLLAWMSSNPR